MTSGPQEPMREPLREPLGRVTSIKVKLGLLVAASVLVAAVLATAGAGTVPAWLSIPVTVLLAIGVTQLLAVGMTSPLRQMTEAARRMAAGHYDVRVRRAPPTRWASSHARSTRCPQTSPRSTGSGATSWPASPMSCVRR